MSIFYNTMYRSRRELVDFAFLFFLISFVMAMCGYVIFGYGASHTHFETLSMSFFTTLGIALGHVDYEAIVGSTFGLEKAQANMFYWILLIVMFLMLNILLSIILDAFEKNQDDRRQIDKPFVQVVAINPISKMLKRLPISKMLKRLSCCKNNKMQTHMTNKNNMKTTYHNLTTQRQSNIKARPNYDAKRGRPPKEIVNSFVK